jgi:TonB family protein
MKRARASSFVTGATLVVAIGAAAWAAVPAAHAAYQEQQAEPSNERIQLDVVVTETGGDSGTAGGATGEPRPWRVRAVASIGSTVVIRGEASSVRATPVLAGDGRVAVHLNVTALRPSWSGADRTAIDVSLSVVLEDGAPTIVAEVTNPADGSVVAVEVTATVLDRAAGQRAAGSRAPLRVGGAVPPPRKTHDVSPSYPSAARTLQVQGVVILETTIGPTGEVVDVKVLRSVPELDAAAIAAVEQWRYEPTLVDGVAVPVVMTVTVNFSLRSRSDLRPAPSLPAPGRPVATGAGGDAPPPAGEPAQPAPSPGR